MACIITSVHKQHSISTYYLWNGTVFEPSFLLCTSFCLETISLMLFSAIFEELPLLSLAFLKTAKRSNSIRPYESPLSVICAFCKISFVFVIIRESNEALAVIFSSEKGSFISIASFESKYASPIKQVILELSLIFQPICSKSSLLSRAMLVLPFKLVTMTVLSSLSMIFTLVEFSTIVLFFFLDENTISIRAIIQEISKVSKVEFVKFPISTFLIVAIQISSKDSSIDLVLTRIADLLFVVLPHLQYLFNKLRIQAGYIVEVDQLLAMPAAIDSSHFQ